MLARFMRSLLLAIAAAMFATVAQAAVIIGGTTYLRIDIGPAFASAGGTINPIGTATYTGVYKGLPVFTLPITGGSTTPPVSVQHFGSGLAFNYGGQTLTLGNLVIDGTSSTILGDGSLGATSFNSQPLFTVASTNDPDFPLLLSTTTTSANAFQTLIGQNVQVSVQVAAANVFNVQTAVPEPATWLMMVGGFCLIGVALRRRRNAVAFA